MTLLPPALAPLAPAEEEAEQAAVIALRRAIHAEPELGLDCPRTRDKLLAALAGLPLAIRPSRRTSGFVAVLRGARPGRTVLLRGDMDALPVAEESGLAFASQVAGRMHACGHDGHSAMLAGAARRLARAREEFAGQVAFLFQPGEEGCHGAREMLVEGLIDDPAPDAAFALHLWPTLPLGQVACRAGAQLASTDTLRATICGRGGHAAMPHDAIDPVPVAAQLVLALQSHVARQAPVSDPIVLSITRIAAGSAHNVIPDAVELLGTLRTLSDAARAQAREAFVRIATHVAAAHGCTARAEIDAGYPVTRNDPRAVEIVRELAGADFAEMAHANMGGEDFSYVLQRVPGAMAFLGAAPEGSDAAAQPPLHNGRMEIDERVLARGVALHVGFALRFLERGFG